MTVSGHTMHVEHRGAAPSDDDTRAVLLLPGALGTARTDFKPQLDGDHALHALHGARLAVYAVDPPGYGASRPPQRDFSWHAGAVTPSGVPQTHFLLRDAATYVELMEQLGWTHFDVVGWSDGANTAALMAGHFPTAVRNLVMFGGNARVTDTDLALYARTRDVAATWSTRMREPLERVYGGATALQQIWSAWNDSMLDFKALADGVVIPDDVLAQITARTLLLHGVKDPMVPPEHPDLFVRHMDVAARVDFPAGKHNPHLRFAEEFNAHVVRFLQQLPLEATANSVVVGSA